MLADLGLGLLGIAAVTAGLSATAHGSAQRFWWALTAMAVAAGVVVLAAATRAQRREARIRRNARKALQRAMSAAERIETEQAAAQWGRDVQVLLCALFGDSGVAEDFQSRTAEHYGGGYRGYGSVQDWIASRLAFLRGILAELQPQVAQKFDADQWINHRWPTG